MANSRFNPLYSSDEIWLGDQTNRCLTDDLDNIYTSLDITIPETYAVKNHVHEQYATVDSVNAKADTEHNHDETYYKKSEVDDKLTALTKEVDDKIASLKQELVELISHISTGANSKTEGAEEATESTKTENASNGETTDEAVKTENVSNGESTKEATDTTKTEESAKDAGASK